MPEQGKMSTFVTTNWKWVMTVLIGSGVLYSEFQSMKQDVNTNKRRLQNYISIIKDQDQVIHELEIRVAILETTEAK